MRPVQTARIPTRGAINPRARDNKSHPASAATAGVYKPKTWRI